MNINLIQVPYDSGYRDFRTGRGPRHFIHKGLQTILENNGHRVAVTTVESNDPAPTEIGTTFENNRLLAAQVRSARRSGRFPIVLAGNCNSCVGTLAGLDNKGLGIVWFDQHGDFNTPETTLTGFLDGMGLAMAAGRCWQQLLTTVPRFLPVAKRSIVHVGSRDLDAAERQAFDSLGIPLLVRNPEDEKAILAALDPVLADLTRGLDRIYLHIDMDVVQTEFGRPNRLAVPGGLPPWVVEAAVGIIGQHFEIAGCTLASYDPAFDENDSVLDAGIRIIRAVVDDKG